MQSAPSHPFPPPGVAPEPESSQEEILPRQFGKYTLLRALASGGMAKVYRAWDSKRAVHVAVKMMNEDLAEDYVFLRRFAQEAQTLQKLNHPNIVRFLDFEEATGLAFMVMEFIDGISLRRFLRLWNRPLSPGEALGFLQPTSSALHPDRMDADERLDEVAGHLAAGLLRLLWRRVRARQNATEKGLEVSRPAWTHGCGTAREGEQP